MGSVTIDSLHLYPVKGCAALDVPSLQIRADGLVCGDRQVMIVDGSGAFLSQRHLPEMTQLSARWADADPHFAALDLAWPGRGTCRLERPTNGVSRSVIVWDDHFDADDAGDAAAQWLSDVLGRAVRCVWLRRSGERLIDPFWSGAARVVTSFADLAPVLLTNASSLDALNDRRRDYGLRAVGMRRFRPTIVVRGLDAFSEDDISTLVAEDGLMLRLIKPCARCKVIELDPVTGEATGDDVLQSLSPFRTQTNRRGTRGVMFGQNGVLTGAGRLYIGQQLTARTCSR